MAVETQYFKNTATQPNTDGVTRFDALPVQGTGTTQVSNNVNDTVYLECMSFERQIIGTLDSTTINASIDVNAFNGTLDGRFRVQAVNGGTVSSSSTYSTVFTTTGIHTATFTLSPTLSSGWTVRLSVEIRRTGGHGNVSITMNVNDADSYFDIDYTPAVATARRRIFIF